MDTRMTGRIIHKTGYATTDINEMVDRLLEQFGYESVLRFIDTVERACDQILAHPENGALLGLDELPYEDMRRWQIDGFDSLIMLYREMADGIEIVRVLSTSRDIPALLKSTPT
jgi:toxin ParE1/3/4